MANRKISALTAILSGDISTANDYLPIVDASVVDADKNKRVTVAELGEAIFGANLETNLLFRGDMVMTSNNQFQLELRRTGGGDRINIGCNAAGSGSQFSTYNDGISDYEPMNLLAEDFRFNARTGVLTASERLRIANSEVTVSTSLVVTGNTELGDTQGDTHQFIGGLTIRKAGPQALLILSEGAGSHAVLAMGRTGQEFYAAISGAPGSWDNNSAAGDMIFRMEAAQSFIFDTGGGTATQLKVAHTASAVNYWNITGNAAGSPPVLSVAGSDTNIGMVIDTKGTGNVAFRNGNGALTFQIVTSALADVNYFQAYSTTTGNSPLLFATGNDADVNMAFSTKGAGIIEFFTGGQSARQFLIGHTASAVNYLQVTGGPAAGNPTITATGSDTNVNLNYVTKGSGGHNFLTAVGAAAQLRVEHTANAVNYLQVTGGAAGSGPVLSAEGSDSNIGLAFVSKGSAGHFFYTNDSELQVRITHTASAVNYLELGGVATGGGPYVQANGSDTNIDLRFFTKGTGSHRFYTDHGATEQVRIDHVAGAVNRMHIYGGATGGKPTLFAAGSDTNIGINLITSGTGPTNFLSHSGNWLQFSVAAVASAVNYIQAYGNTTGNDPVLEAAGSDTNVNVALIGKGTGGVRFYKTDGGLTEVGRFSGDNPADGATALLIRRNVGGAFSLQTVTMGAADSGGAGFKVLRVPN